MIEETVEKLIKLIAESDSLTQIGEKYINYLYFETAATAALAVALFGLICYVVYKLIKSDMP